MSTRFRSIDRDTPMLLPPDLRDWVAADDPVHFVLEVIKALPAAPFAVNVRGSGSEQYPPSMMLALLQTLEERVAELLAKAEAVDAQDEDERLPQELADRQRLRDKVQEAKERIEARAKEHADKMKETPVKERRGRNDKRHPKDDAPAPTDRDNLSDPDSRLMRTGSFAGMTGRMKRCLNCSNWP